MSVLPSPSYRLSMAARFNRWDVRPDGRGSWLVSTDRRVVRVAAADLVDRAGRPLSVCGIEDAIRSAPPVREIPIRTSTDRAPRRFY